MIVAFLRAPAVGRWGHAPLLLGFDDGLSFFENHRKKAIFGL